ncbi:RNase A-like domain-containing protein [Stenotrophomonas sp. AB1(2024)]|uniref:RNase A-like domain-containing protein n=1 Tax=Stenotrophomonas sp. AB1(2024) TaxID=3132215 RepID=UPI0030A25DD5
MNCKRRQPKLGNMVAQLICLFIVLAAWPAAAQTVTYVHTDALGSVVAKTDENGNVVERFDYEPYGAPVGAGVQDGPAYTGHVSDSATGLSYMQQRYMDPQLGVFLSVDPVTADQEPIDQFNRYRYANGNPYKFIDPDGRLACNASVSCSDTVQRLQQQGIFPLQSAGSGSGSNGNGRLDLRIHEGGGARGHAISEHVGKSDEYLRRKLNDSISVAGLNIYKGFQSSFSSVESANSLVSSVISRDRAKIDNWTSSPFARMRPLVLDRSFSSPTGRVAYRNGKVSYRTPGPVQFATGFGVRVVLKYNDTSPAGYDVLTAFPTR